MSRFSVRNFLWHSADKDRNGNASVFHQFQESKIVMHKRGMSWIFVEVFVSQ